MAKYTVAATQTGTKTSLRGPTLVVGAKTIHIVEVGVESTTAVSSQVALRRFPAAGTTGTALDEVPWENDGQAPTAAGSQLPSTDHTAVAGLIRQGHLPDAIGGGIIWTFGPRGLTVYGGTGDGVFLSLPGGSDAVINFYFDWEE